jgi:integrase
MVAMSTLLRWAASWDLIERNPLEGFRLPKRREKVSDGDKRKPFTPEQLRAIDAKLTEAYDETSDDRWVPIVAAYQGCRLEEVTQLRKTDVRQVGGGTWIIEFTDAGEDQKLKNRGSKRTLPIHPALIARGFLEHWQRSPGPNLFASLKADTEGRFGGPYGKRFSRFLRTKVKISDPLLTFHSFRHAWKTAARNAGVPEAEQATIMGHTHGTPVSDGYGDKHAVNVLLPLIAKVDPFVDP